MEIFNKYLVKIIRKISPIINHLHNIKFKKELIDSKIIILRTKIIVSIPRVKIIFSIIHQDNKTTSQEVEAN